MTGGRVPDRDGQGATDPVAGAAREPSELVVTLSPRQIIGGFAFVAALIVWLVRLARRRS